MAHKSVLITGCSEGGIGDALAKEFHRNGLRVFATARNLAKVQHLKELGLDVLCLDVTDDSSIKEAVARVQATTDGRLDILVNNAGGGYSQPLMDTEALEAKKMFDLNVFALISVTKAFSPLLIASKGTVINIGSVAGKAPIPWQGYYNASKAAVNILSDTLRIELAPFGVKVVNITTGGIKTKFFENMETLKLPEGSIYLPAREEIEETMSGAIIEKDGTDVEVYATAVVKNALKSNPKTNQWVGSNSLLIWLVGTFLWHTAWDNIFQGPFKLSAVGKKIQAVRD